MLKDYRPFSPHTQVLGPNEIKVQWLPVSNRKGVNIIYELYNGNDLEYRGHDLTYNARRLHAGEEYKFQLRVCNSLITHDCSQFSIPRYQTLSGKSI